ncbi:hypothetical protein [Pseudorhodoplanes sp.]|uniref:hypothetical protein n=1 Tax=Pseudorhodoplanes sp. TaxID=1934341 RepID=UPI0039197A76
MRDPFDACEKVTEDIQQGLTSYKCSPSQKVDQATWIVGFDLGQWDVPYSRFAVYGGRELKTVDRPFASLTTCRRVCTFHQVSSIKIPFDVLFSPEALANGLVVKAFGGPRDVFLKLSAERIRAFRSGLERAGFVPDGHQ